MNQDSCVEELNEKEQILNKIKNKLSKKIDEIKEEKSETYLYEPKEALNLLIVFIFNFN